MSQREPELLELELVPLGKLELELGVTVTEHKLRELLTDAVSVAEEYPMAAAGGGAWGSWIGRAELLGEETRGEWREGVGVDKKTGERDETDGKTGGQPRALRGRPRTQLQGRG